MQEKRASLTVSLVIALAEASTIALVLLVEALLLASILGVVSLLIVLLLLLLLLRLLVLGRISSAVSLARLEGLGVWLKGGDAWAEIPLRLGGVLGVHVELLLGLAREALVLSSGVILPRVEVGHSDGIDRFEWPRRRWVRFAWSGRRGASAVEICLEWRVSRRVMRWIEADDWK